MVAPGREMPKAYDPRDVERRLYARWEESGAFAPHGDAERPAFTIIMPPPNVTGDLHLGHALTDTIEDTLVRWHRMLGDRTLWLPGVDHAGIATQMVVERELAREGLTRHEIGRERFVERVWQWVDRTRANIANQHRRLGDSCDWSREVFTLDPIPALAVRTTFKRLYDDGLIYRGERIINWCPRCQTAISDLEVDYDDEEGALWQIRYPILNEDGSDSGSFITMATTRPETIVGDTGIAVNPEDPRYAAVAGRKARLPIIGRILPIVADDAVDPAFGTGAVKVTPGHDPTDFEIGERHGLPVVSVMNLDGTMNEQAGPFAGMDRLAARDEIVKVLEGGGLLVKREPYTHAVGHCQRCGTIVEPLVSKQWFVRIQPLAAPALEAVRDGRITIVPDFFGKTYENWMTNIRDWCISRQLWWGHRIPVWYCEACDAAIVEIEPPQTCPACLGSQLRQDEDVLDTWFSSGLWPFSTLGWPKETDQLRTYYPTDVMETGYDILFFWVARMIMLGLYDTGSVPFRHVYLHGLVRDKNGLKMSKTRGNALDPLELIDQYGTDALRFALATGSTPGIDMRLQPDKLENARNFANKIWNAARFLIAKLDSEQLDATVTGISLPVEDRWIRSRCAATVESVTRLLGDFQIGEAGRQIYDFLWNEYCDWYIELAKARLNQGDRSAIATLVDVLAQSLALLHPLMPFVTEEIWQHLRSAMPQTAELLMTATWPVADPDLEDERAEGAVAALADIVRAIRNTRAEKGVKPDRWVAADVVIQEASLLDDLRPLADAIGQLSRARPLRLLASEAEAAKDSAVSVVLSRAQVLLPMAGLFDAAAERARLEKQLAESESEAHRHQSQLENDAFRARAPANVVAGIEAKHAMVRERIEGIRRSLADLTSA